MSLIPESTQQITFKPICFSTNYQNFNSISIMKQYFMSTECVNVVYTNNNQVDFIHKISGENGAKIECKNTYIEIYPLTKNNIIIDITDCYIIFFDLEDTESLVQINKILNYISDFGDSSKKVYVIKIYTNEKNIKNNYTDDNIKVYLDNYGITNYGISSMNIDSSTETEKVIDTLTEETLQEKNKLDINIDINNDKSKSFCLLI